MENRWSVEQARGLDELSLLAYRSRLLGEPAIVNPGGGNTSIKRRLTDFRGREVDVLTVKASGSDLAGIKEKGFVDVALEPLMELRSRDRMTDEEMVAYLARCVLDPAAPRPSIETLLHGFLPARHVDHTHPELALALATADKGEEVLEKLFGDEAVWVPYLRPGFAMACMAAGAAAAHPKARFIVLQKHGLVTWADDPKACYQQTLEFLQRVEGYLGVSLKTPTAGSRKAAAVLPELRGFLGGAILRHSAEPFVDEPRSRELVERGLACPDHVLYTGVRPLFLDVAPDAAAETVLEEAQTGVAAYQEDYRRFFETHRKPGDEMRETLPRVVLVPGVGVITAGKDIRAAETAMTCYRSSIRIMEWAETAGSFASLTEDEAYDVEYWPLELYKLSLLPPPKELAGRIALVTGGAGAIGRAVCRRFAEEGACVVVADLNLEGAQQVASECDNALAVRMDVTSEASVRVAVEQTALTYGGLDILVCNAGIAFSHPVEETSLKEWKRTMAVLSTGYFLTSKRGIALMRRQGLGGSVIFMASKAGLAAARNAAAYASAKAATLHLARCLAEEVAGDGIRVNSLAPDAIIEGSGLWAGQWGAARARAHGVPQEQLAEFYRNRNMLKIGVTADDVAEAALFLASNRSRATTGAILSVDGGLHDGYVR